MNESLPSAAGDPPIDAADLARHVSGERKAVVLFEMSGCPYCVAFRPRFLELAQERGADFAFLRVLLDDPGSPLWHEYGIKAIPTVIAFSQGWILARADSVLALGLTKRAWSDFRAALP